MCFTRAAWKQDLTEWVAAGLNGYIGAGLPGNDVPVGLIEWTKQDMYQTSLLALVECNRTQVETDFRPEMGKSASRCSLFKGPRRVGPVGTHREGVHRADRRVHPEGVRERSPWALPDPPGSSHRRPGCLVKGSSWQGVMTGPAR